MMIWYINWERIPSIKLITHASPHIFTCVFKLLFWWEHLSSLLGNFNYRIPCYQLYSHIFHPRSSDLRPESWSLLPTCPCLPHPHAPGNHFSTLFLWIWPLRVFLHCWFCLIIHHCDIFRAGLRRCWFQLQCSYLNFICFTINTV